jgi:hypothetical protein
VKSIKFEKGRGWVLDGAIIDWKNVLANDVTFRWEYNPHNVSPWAIFNEYGLIAIAWGGYEGEALDEAVDADLLDSLMLDEDADKDEQEAATSLGNAGELFDLNNVMMVEVDMKTLPVQVAVAFAEARGAGSDNVDDYIRNR